MNENKNKHLVLAFGIISFILTLACIILMISTRSPTTIGFFGLQIIAIFINFSTILVFVLSLIGAILGGILFHETKSRFILIVLILNLVLLLTMPTLRIIIIFI